MSKPSKKELSIIEVAQLLFHTASPTDEQIQRVYKRMKSGALPVRDYGRGPVEWTTTEGALAEFMAAQMLKPRGTAQHILPRDERAQRSSASAPSSRRIQEAKKLRSVYLNISRDYFLAVMLRRRMAHRSASFRRGVLAGQIVLLAIFAGLTIASFRIALGPTLPEQVAIVNWIGQHTDRHQIVRWYPTAPDTSRNGLIVEVEYRYCKDSPRMITTRRVFCVNGDEVQEISID
jgi:hypothetical protein